MSDVFRTPPPIVKTELVQEFLYDNYDIIASIEKLSSDRDLNLKVCADDKNFVMKIANSSEDKSILQMQNNALRHISLQDESIEVPIPIKSKHKKDISIIKSHNSRNYVRLLTYIEGDFLKDVKPNSNMLFSVGEFRNRFLAQEKENINGKVIKVNIENFSYEIISMGHRNPQGLYYDKKNNFIIETEHGPMGGDEINLIEISKINKEKPLNYGWAIVSAGEHYKGKVKDNKEKYRKYPLYKSHTKYGFVEPLKSFVPSIGISEVTKIGNNKFVVSSMKDKSLYFFELDNKKEIQNLERVEVFERVRDLKFHNDKLYLFLEEPASIGVISFN